MKTTIYAILTNGHNGTDVKKYEIGKAILDEGRMSARTYDVLKRKMFKECGAAPKAHYWRIETAEGLRDSFGGYPANGYVSYVKFVEVH